MEILFENRCLFNEKWVKAANKVALFRTPLFLTLHIIFLAFFLFGVIKFLLFQIIDLIFLFIPVWFYIVILLRLLVSNKRTIKIKKEMYGEKPEVVSSVTEECIEQIHSNGMRNKILYANIIRGYISGDYIFLQSKGNILYSLSRNRFTVGTEQEFISFLREKGIKVR